MLKGVLRPVSFGPEGVRLAGLQPILGAGMVKVITFIKRKPGMPVEEFQSYRRTRHPEVVTRLPGVRRYVQ
jgi:hypothetical protein